MELAASSLLGGPEGIPKLPRLGPPKDQRPGERSCLGLATFGGSLFVALGDTARGTVTEEPTTCVAAVGTETDGHAYVGDAGTDEILGDNPGTGGDIKAQA